MPKLVNVNQLDKNSIEYAFNLNQRTEKIVTFIFPSLIEGAFGPLCKFPIGGKIKKIEAYCQDVASVDTIFTIEKSTQEQITKFTSDEQQLVADLTKLTNSHTELVDATDSKKTNCKDNLVTSMLVTPWKKILSSNIPSFILFPITILIGIPIRSISLNLIPGLSSLSSINVSIPKELSFSYRS